MSFKIGIVGLPNVGKSTLFKALTKRNVKIGPYPFTTIEPNIGQIEVPDKRLLKIAQIVKPEKITQTTIEFIDIAGLVKGAHKGEGLGNQFLSYIRNCDGILIVTRGFEDQRVENVLGKIDPKEEIEILKTELLMKDFETLNKAIETLEKKPKQKEIQKKLNLLKKLREEVAKGKLISEIRIEKEDELLIREFQFLTKKPILYLININSSQKHVFWENALKINLKEEEEMSELTQKEQKELGFTSALDKIILACYNTLDLITFYTIAKGKEAKAWTLKKGENILNAAKKVHSDFKEKFIKAEVLNFKDLAKSGSLEEARKRGLIKTVGRDYFVQDGDIIEFKI